MTDARLALRVVLIGARGRLGAAVATALREAGHQVTALDREDLDITNGRQVAAVLPRLRPAAIVNCAAYNAVDAAERDPSAAFAVNAIGPSFLAAAARRCGAVFVHYSTDFGI